MRNVAAVLPEMDVMPVPPAVVVVDIDGTLRRHGQYIGDGVALMLRAMIEQGVVVVPCSGKNLEFITKLFNFMEIPTPVIGSENGGYISSLVQGAWHHDSAADRTKLRLLRAHIDSCPECNSWTIGEQKHSMITKRFGSYQKAAEVAPIWKSHARDLFPDEPCEVFLYPPADDAVDLVLNPKRVYKGRLIAMLRHYYPGAPIVVAEDGLNGMSMVKAEGVLPVCPSTADEQIKLAVQMQGGMVASEPYSDGTLNALRWALRQFDVKL